MVGYALDEELGAIGLVEEFGALDDNGVQVCQGRARKESDGGEACCESLHDGVFDNMLVDVRMGCCPLRLRRKVRRGSWAIKGTGTCYRRR